MTSCTIAPVPIDKQWNPHHSASIVLLTTTIGKGEAFERLSLP
jgi:hypothetical protein